MAHDGRGINMEKSVSDPCLRQPADQTQTDQKKVKCGVVGDSKSLPASMKPAIIRRKSPDRKVLKPVCSRYKKISDWIALRSTSFPNQLHNTQGLRLRRGLLGRILRPSIQARLEEVKAPVNKIQPTHYTGDTLLRSHAQLVTEEARTKDLAEKFSTALRKIDLTRLPISVRRALKPLADGRERLIRNGLPVRPLQIPNPSLKKGSETEVKKEFFRKKLRLSQVFSAFNTVFNLNLVRGIVKPRFRLKGRISKAEKEAQIKNLEILVCSSLGQPSVLSLRKFLEVLRQTPSRSDEGEGYNGEKADAASLFSLISPKKMLMHHERKLLKRDGDRARIFSSRARQERYDNMKLILNYLTRIEDSVNCKPRPWIHKQRHTKWRLSCARKKKPSFRCGYRRYRAYFDKRLITRGTGHNSKQASTLNGIQDEERLKMPPPQFLPPRSRTRASSEHHATHIATQAPAPRSKLSSAANVQPRKGKSRSARKKKPKIKVYTIRRGLSVHPGDIFRSMNKQSNNYVFSRSVKTVSEESLRLLTTAFALKCSFTEYPAGVVGAPVKLQDSKNTSRGNKVQCTNSSSAQPKIQPSPFFPETRRSLVDKQRICSTNETLLLKRHEKMLTSVAAFLSQSEACGSTDLRAAMIKAFSPVTSVEPSTVTPTISQFLDIMPSFSKLAECSEVGHPTQSLNWDSFLHYHQCPGCTLVSKVANIKKPGVKVYLTSDAKTKQDRTSGSNDANSVGTDSKYSAKDRNYQPVHLSNVFQIKNIRSNDQPATTMKLTSRIQRTRIGGSGTVIPRNPEMEHTIELLRYRRLIQRRLEVFESDQTILGLDDFPVYRPLQESEKVKLSGSPSLVPMDNKLIQTSLAESTAVLIAHAGFTHASQSAVDVLSNLLQDFLVKITGRLKEVQEKTAVGESIGFNDPLERVMIEQGMSKGILGLHDYYKSRVIDSHRWVLKDCLKLRSEYASKIALKMGSAEQSNRTGKATSAPSPGNCQTNTAATESGITMPTSLNVTAAPTNGNGNGSSSKNLLEYLSSPPQDTFSGSRSLSTLLGSSIELNQSNLLRLNFVDEFPNRNSMVGSPAPASSSNTMTFISSHGSPSPAPTSQ